MSQKTSFCWDEDIDADLGAWLREKHAKNEASKAIRAAIRATIDGQKDGNDADKAAISKMLDRIEAKLETLNRRIADMERRLENL
jgi:hypothetical protein